MVAAAGEPVLVVPAGEEVTLRDLTLEGEGAPVVVVRGVLRARNLTLRGGRAAIRIEGGEAHLEAIEVEGCESAIHVSSGSATVRDLRVRGAGSAALYASKGRLTVNDAKVEGAEYGLMTAPGATVEVDGLRVRGAHRAGVALVGGAGRLVRLDLEGGSHGGLLANDLKEPLVLESVTIRGVTGAGVQVMRGNLTARDLTISQVRRDSSGGLGMGLLLDQTEARLSGLEISGVGGEGLAALGGAVHVSASRIQQTGEAGVQAWRGAQVTLQDVTVRQAGGPALSAVESARITFRSGEAAGAAVADCGSGARIVVEAAARVSGARLGCVEP